MTIYLDDIEIKSRAPKASNWNRLFESMDDLNDDVKGHAVVLNRTSNQALSWPADGTDQTVLFDNEVIDTDGIWSSGNIVLPDWVVAYRVTWNVRFTTYTNLSLLQFSWAFEVGGDSDADGVQSFNVMTYWRRANGGDSIDNELDLDAPSGSSITVEGGNNTWMLVEFL